MFERIGISKTGAHSGRTVLIIGGAGAASLKRAHALLEGGRVIGKIVLEGFSAS